MEEKTGPWGKTQIPDDLPENDTPDALFIDLRRFIVSFEKTHASNCTVLEKTGGVNGRFRIRIDTGPKKEIASFVEHHVRALNQEQADARRAYRLTMHYDAGAEEITILALKGAARA